ncbi:hypothetical protein KJ567_03835 [Candidatus Bipolaricaulota bacterium]|nr:hypothetical protein [Candidatus Bipolaricaulota bacterium]
MPTSSFARSSDVSAHDFLKLDNRGVYVFPHCAEPKHLPNTHGTRAREIAARLFER